MVRAVLRFGTALGAIALAIPAQAQEQDITPAPVVEAASPAMATAAPTAAPENAPTPASPESSATAVVETASPPIVLADSEVDAFYAARGGAALWMRNANFGRRPSGW